MLNFLSKIDNLSFWLGFGFGAFAFFIVERLFRLMPRFIKYIKEKIELSREKITASTEARLASDIVKFAQRQHLAAPLFALDEILITPRIIAPPVFQPSEGSTDTNTLLPYLPDWPEVPASFNTPTLTLPEAMQAGANLILMGPPGVGKTTALAHLASLAAHDDPAAGDLAPLTPFLVHAADFPPAALSTTTPLEVLIEVVAKNASTLTLPRLPNLMNTLFEHKRALVLVDGMDELPPVPFQQMTGYLKTLLQKYPGTRLVVATSTDYYSGLNALGLIPVALSTWNERQRQEFLLKWGQMWSTHIVPDTIAGPNDVDALLLNNWLAARDVSLTPLELTLKIWAAYAGDVRGPEGWQAIEAYLRRVTYNIPNARPALEQLAIQMVLTQNPAITQKEAENWVADYEQSAAATPIAPTLTDDPAKAEGAKPAAAKSQTSFRMLPTLVSAGLLVSRSESRLSFFHPILIGYLAGQTLSKPGANISSIQSQPEWLGKLLTLTYLAAFGDVSNVINVALSQKDDPLRRSQLMVGRWLRHAPKNAPWRGPVMRYFANAIQKEFLTIGLSARFLAAMALSGDTSVGALFRQMLKSEHEVTRQLGALGSGLLHDVKAIDDLGYLANEESPIISQTACLALVAIGNKQATEAVMTALVQGSEAARRAAAEALADDPGEGHAVL
jgi:hypothetical protein